MHLHHPKVLERRTAKHSIRSDYQRKRGLSHRYFGAVVVLALTCLLSPKCALAEGRMALVVGNSTYTNGLPQLNAPLNDAKSMGEALRDLGFKVTDVSGTTNLTQARFKSVLNEFAAEVARSQPDWALIYYSGHGMEVRGGPASMIPTDSSDGISVIDVLDAIRGVKLIKLIIYDACRDPPGLAEMARNATAAKLEARISSKGSGRTANEAIWYAGKHGLTVDDGAYNSPYTAVLLSHIKKRNLELNALVSLVTEEVEKKSPIKQRPFTYGSLGSQPLYFDLSSVPSPPVPPDEGKYSYWNGEYVGPLKDGKPNGIGRLVGNGKSDLVEYVGSFRNGFMEGEGRATYADRSSYVGMFRNSVRSGFGTYTYSDGAVYAGQWADGSRNGSGTLTSDGEISQGTWLNDQLHGSANTVTAKNSSYRYSGAHKNGKASGYGKVNFENDSRYEGYFNEGLMEGKGKFTYPDGRTLEGSWRKGQPSGGMVLTSAKTTYWGPVNSNWNPQGQGTRIWKENGERYDGGFQDGGRSGKGTQSFSDGGYIEGSWSNHDPTGQMFRKWSNGNRYWGPLASNLEPHGTGIMILSNGDRYDGKFHQGEKNGFGIYQWYSNGDR